VKESYQGTAMLTPHKVALCEQAVLYDVANCKVCAHWVGTSDVVSVSRSASLCWMMVDTASAS